MRSRQAALIAANLIRLGLNPNKPHSQKTIEAAERALRHGVPTPEVVSEPEVPQQSFSFEPPVVVVEEQIVPPAPVEEVVVHETPEIPVEEKTPEPEVEKQSEEIVEEVVEHVEHDKPTKKKSKKSAE